MLSNTVPDNIRPAQNPTQNISASYFVILDNYMQITIVFAFVLHESEVSLERKK